MKLPFFSTSSPEPVRPAERVDPPWQTLVLVCEKCKGARRGPDARGIRKGIKQRLGKQKRLRVVEVHCLGVCPDDAVTVCTLRPATGTPELCLVRSEEELDQLAASVDPSRA